MTGNLRSPHCENLKSWSVVYASLGCHPWSNIPSWYCLFGTWSNVLLYGCRSVVDQYFGGTFDCELKCIEAEDEPPSFSKENFLQLSCFISQDVRYMLSGLRSVSTHD
jgi:hypothetical protein